MAKKQPEKATDAELPETVTGRALGALTGLTDRQIRNLASEGVVVKADRGRYLLIASNTALLERAKSQGTDAISAARADYATAKAEAAKLANAEKRRELIPTEDVLAAIDIMIAKFRDELAGLPARFTRDMDLRRKLEAETHASLNRIADAFDATAKFVQEGGDLNAGGESDDA